MPEYNDKDIVEAIRTLRDMSDKLKKLGRDIKKIELVRKGN